MSINAEDVIKCFISLSEISEISSLTPFSYMEYKIVPMDANIAEINLITFPASWGAIGVSKSDIYYFDRHNFHILGPLNDLTTITKAFFILMEYNKFHKDHGTIDYSNYHHLFNKIRHIIFYNHEPHYV